MQITWCCSSPDDYGVKVAWPWTPIHIITCEAQGLSNWAHWLQFCSNCAQHLDSSSVLVLLSGRLKNKWRQHNHQSNQPLVRNLWLVSTFLHSASHFLVFFHGYESNQEASERYCKDGWRQQSNVLCSSAPTWRGQAIPFAWNSKVGSTAGAAQVQILGMFIWVWWVWWDQMWNPDFLCLLRNVL